MPVCGDGKIEEPVLQNIRDRFSKDEFFKPVLKELITDILDARIPKFIQSPSSLKDTLGSSWENVLAHNVHGGDGYEFVANPKGMFGKYIDHDLTVNTDKHTVCISMHDGPQGLNLAQVIEAEYDPKTLTVKPETIQEYVSFDNVFYDDDIASFVK